MTTTTPNMNLVLPDVSLTTGPQWATLLNQALTAIDSHNHTTGEGQKITPSGINISSDLSFGLNNAIGLRTLRLNNYSSFTGTVNDKGCFYVLNNELYYVDGVGNTVQVTSNGAVNISGSITSLSIKDSALFLQYFGDTSRQFRFNASQIPAATTRIFSLPDPGSDDTLVSLVSTQTITNKTMGGTNTLTGVKLASLTPDGSHTVTMPAVTDTLAGLTATQTITNKILTGNTAANLSPDGVNVLTLPSRTDTLATLGATQTLTATTLAGGAVSDRITFTNAAAPATPSAGKSSVYVNSTDNQLHLLNSAGTDMAIGASSSSGKNYLQAYYGFSLNPVTNAVVNLTSAGNRTTNTGYWGTSAASAATTMTYNTGSPLRAPGDLQITFPAAAANSFVESSMFTLDLSDAQSNTQFISFDMNASTAGWTSGDVTVAVKMYNSSGTYLSTIIPSITNIPSGYYRFKAPFSPTTTAGNQYSIVFLNITTSARTLDVQNVLVGPQQVIEANSIGNWISYTPTFGAGFGTPSAITFAYRRVGDSLQVQGNFTCGTVAASASTISLPSSLAVDSTKIPAKSGSTLVQVGTWRRDNTTIANSMGSILADSTSTSLLYFGNSVTGASPLQTANGSTLASTGEIQSVSFQVPIANWSAGITLASSSNPIEYVYNTTTSDAADTTSFGSGANGGLVPSALTAARLKRVRFSAAIQPTDRIQVEVRAGTTGVWMPVNATDSGFIASPLQYQNAVTYGVGYQSTFINNTDLDICFGQYKYPSGATFASAGAAWAGANYYRVAKYSSIGAAEIAPATQTSSGTISRECGWTAYTPIIGAGFGTATSIYAYYKVVGDSLFLRFGFTTGTVAASSATVSLPSSFSLNTTKCPTGTSIAGVGASGGTTATVYTALLNSASVGTLNFGAQSAAFSGLTAQLGNVIFVSSTGYGWTAEIPI